MKILNLGSLNIDKVYSVEHFVAAGETLSASKMETFSGGKGLNQSIALSRAGAEVYQAGAIGPDGESLRYLLAESKVHTDHLQTLAGEVTGHAIIQLTPAGQNCIIISTGANGALTKSYIDEVLNHFEAGDMLLLQNETNNVAYAMQQAKARGMRIAFNASPISGALLQYPLELVDYYLINEVEAKVLSGGEETDNEKMLEALNNRFPNAAIVLTVGKRGVLYQYQSETLSHGIYDVPVVDTTAAGDTFCGFFLACVAKGLPTADGLRIASLASNLAVSKKGAANSIPTWDEVLAFGEIAKAL